MRLRLGKSFLNLTGCDQVGFTLAEQTKLEHLPANGSQWAARSKAPAFTCKKE